MMQQRVQTETPSVPPETGRLWPVSDEPAGPSVPWRGLALLTAAAAVLRLIALNQQLWYDEITTLLDFVRPPFGRIFVTYSSENQHFLYSILAWISVHTFGDHPWTLRLPAVLFGVLSIPTLYLLARRLTTRAEALWACALMTVSYHHVWFSQNARGYTGLLLFTLVATYFFVRGSRENRQVFWIGYGIAAALGVYVHLSMAFIVAGHGLVYLWMLASRHRELQASLRDYLRPLAGFVVAGGLSLVLYSPVLGQVFARASSWATARVTFEWSNPRWLLEETLRGLTAGMGAAGLLVVISAAFVAFVGFVSYWRANRYAVGLLVLPGLTTATVLAALGHNLWPRMFFFSIGFAFLFLVRGVMRVAEWMVSRVGGSARAAQFTATAFLILGMAGSVWMLRAAYLYPKQDFVGAMEAVEAARQPGEPVVTVGLTTIPYRAYYGRDWPAVKTGQELQALRAHGSRVWLLYTSPIHLRARHPDIWNIIQAEFATVRIFRGTLGNGEVYICQAPPR